MDRLVGGAGDDSLSGGFGPDTLFGNAGRDLLMALPGMTYEIADAMLDWIDEDDEIREYGAEVDYYSSLDPPYAPKNGPLESVEELLLVRDVTAQLFFGSDANRNGNIEQKESENGQTLCRGNFHPGISITQLRNQPVNFIAFQGHFGVAINPCHFTESVELQFHQSSHGRIISPELMRGLIVD